MNQFMNKKFLFIRYEKVFYKFFDKRSLITLIIEYKNHKSINLN